MNTLANKTTFSIQRPDRPAWLASKKFGDEGEQAAASFFRGLGLLVAKNEGLAPHDLDIRGQIEVKHDRRAVSSGNIAVEVRYRGRPSGIATSTASGWCFVVGLELLLMPTKTLRELVAGGSYPKVPAGECAICALVPIDEIRDISRSVRIGGAK